MNRSVVITLCSYLFVCAMGCHRDRAPLTPTPPPWLDTVVHDQAKQAAPDAALVGEVLKSTAMREDDSTKWPIQLEAGTCYLFSGAGDQSVEELYLALRDSDDDRVADDSNDSPRIVLQHCPEASGSYEIEAKVKEGHGHFAVGIYAKPGQPVAAASTATSAPGAPGATAPTPSVSTAAPAASDLGRVITNLARASAPDAARLGEPLSGEAEVTDWYVALEDGKCYWFIGAGDPGVKQLHLTLWGPSEKRVTVNKSDTNQVSVGHCPAASGMYHVQAKVQRGAGKYKVGVFAKKK